MIHDSDKPECQPKGAAGATITTHALDLGDQTPAQWLPPKAAAEALGVSVATVKRHGMKGKIAFRQRPDGVHVYKITEAATRAMVSAKNAAQALAHSIDVAQSITRGESVESLMIRGVPPNAIAKALREYRAAIAEIEAIKADVRQREDAAMLREAASGAPLVPSSFAWLATKLAVMPHEEAVEKYGEWKAAGGSEAIVSPFVARALSSADAWREAGARWAHVRAAEEARAHEALLRQELEQRKAIANADHAVQRLDRTEAEIEAAAARIESVREATRLRREADKRARERIEEEKRNARKNAEGNSAQPHIEAGERKTKKPAGSFAKRMEELVARRMAKEEDGEDDEADG